MYIAATKNTCSCNREETVEFFYIYLKVTAQSSMASVLTPLQGSNNKNYILVDIRVLHCSPNYW